MSERWSIKPDWAQLETGSPEEQAGFAALAITAYGACLTEGHDRLLQSIRQAPYLSAYHLAEWLAWNWWRLRWEPRKNSLEWKLSHAMASIGAGYIWPNIQLISDGRNISLNCKPTPERTRTPYRYISDSVAVIPAADFENEVDRFIDTIIQRLATREITQSNLHAIWQAVLEERSDPASHQRRKFEALLGEDPGEVDDEQLDHLFGQAQAVGQSALEEVAANRNSGDALPDVAALINLGREEGIRTCPQDAVVLCKSVPARQNAAWRVGAQTAQALRAQERLEPTAAITNAQLSEMYGASQQIIEAPAPTHTLHQPTLSFALVESGRTSRVWLRPGWKNVHGRRFEVARLLGDALTQRTDDAMRPATRVYTYRQKIQRAFAAEFLSPFSAVEEMLDGDYSMENQQEVAEHFHVSALTIRTLLVNNKRIDRSALDEAELAYA